MKTQNSSTALPSKATISHKGSHKKLHKGFALVATIIVMSMLMLLSVSMLTMSSVSTRSAALDDHQRIAEANARMAAMIALGELQEYMGPDQRVSANASIFDTSPDDATQITGVSNPHWVGAWKTTYGDKDEPMIYSESGSGGYLTDRRSGTGSGAFSHKDAVLKYFVSGTKPDDKNEALTSHANQLKIITSINEANNVYVPKVNTKNGAYAYHVKDLGQTAPVYQYNPYAGGKIEDTEEGHSLLYTGSHRPFNEIVETKGPLDHLSSAASLKSKEKEFKNLTLHQGEVESSDSDAMRELLKQYVHDLDIPGEALIIDTVNSGLKIDLTPYIEQTGAAGTGTLKNSAGTTILSDTTTLIDPSRSRFNQFSPRFGILRDYANLGQHIDTSGSVTPRPPLMGSGKLGAYPSYNNFIQAPIHPYITEFSVYMSIVTDSSSPSGITALIYPRVTLYNPHNVTLKASKYFVHINRKLYFLAQTPDMNGDGGRETYGLTAPYWGVNGGEETSAGNSYLPFMLDPIEMKPGEALVFTPKEKLRKLELLNGNVSKNILSATVSPDTRNAFSWQMWGGVKYNKSKGNGTYNVKRYWENGYHVGYGDSTSARLRLNIKEQTPSSYFGGISANANYPIVHTLDAQNWKRGNEGKWRDINKTLPLGDIASTSSVNPVNRTMLGFRMKAPDEAASNLINAPNGFWKEAIINNFNLRAGHHHRTPSDHMFAVQTVLHEHAYGPYTPDNQEQPDYTSSFMRPSYRDGKYKFSPLLGSQGDGIEMPLFDIPTKNASFYSIGQFRSSPLTQVFDHPSHIIGESIAPRTTPRGKTAATTSNYNTSWTSSFHTGRVTGESTWYDTSTDPVNNYMAYDVRYETNHALWDSYFFSTYDDAATTGDKLKNSKIILTEEVIENGADRIAEYLRLKGHLNVNSTSVLAWKAILMMNAGTKVEASLASSSGTPSSPPSDSTPYPGLMESTEGSVNGDTSSIENTTWNGHRALSSDEAQLLAEAIVAQVKKRAPFIGVSDFVNRRLKDITTPDTDPRTQTDDQKLSYAGAMDIAIMEAGLNNNLKDYEPAYNVAQIVGTSHGNPSVSQGNQPTELFNGAATHLSQGKILQTIGANLTARSDTFKIRAYGESKTASGAIKATAVCEIIVQRSARYIDTTESPETKFEDLTSDLNKKYGRKFEIVSFKWLVQE